MGKGLDKIQYIADFSPLRLGLELDNENELDQLGLELRLNPISYGLSDSVAPTGEGLRGPPLRYQGRSHL